MTLDIAVILGIDGIATGSIYVLVGLGLVLIFSVTRVVFVPFGDIVAFSALTLAAMQLNRMPGTVYLIATLAVLACLVDAGHHCAARSVQPHCPGAPRLWRAAAHSRRDRLADRGHELASRSTNSAGHCARRADWAVARTHRVAAARGRIGPAPAVVSVALTFGLSGLGLLFFGA